MAGTSGEYERLCLIALGKASQGNTDFGYHHEQATIFATLALAAATENGGRPALSSVPMVDDGDDEPKRHAS